jgi:eukaryotic-like serine/threonine-protein kinase
MPEHERRCAKCGAAYGGDVLFCPADGTPLASRPLGAELERLVGQTLREEFVLEALIGVGAMASVFRARRLGVERDVAVKIMHADLAHNAELVARFRREARAAARIRHPGVIEVVSAGDLAGPGGPGRELPYLVFEFLDGHTLRSALSAAGGTLPLGRALHVVLQASDAVGEAHDNHVVHRDLKPENAMLVRRGDDPDFVKLLDFGLSRFAQGDAGVETRAGAVLGTARYVSPEGARGEVVGPPADVYALATILFECLAGRTPFDGDRPVAILVAKSNAAAPDVRSFERARDVPEKMATLLAAGLAKDPALRPPNARAFGQALARAAEECGLGREQLFTRPTLFGARSSSRLPRAALTQVLGSPGSVPEPSAAATSAPARAAAERESPRARTTDGMATALPAPLLRHVGVITVCFVLGVLGALGIATQVGSCERAWP